VKKWSQTVISSLIVPSTRVGQANADRLW
jgi:hypothetical protein